MRRISKNFFIFNQLCFIKTSLVSVYASIVFFCFFLSKTILYIEKLKKKQKKQETKKPKNHVSSENFLLDKFSLEFLFSSLDTLISNSSIEAFYFQYKVWQNWP